MLPTREGQRHGMAPRARPGERPERRQPVAWLAGSAACRAGVKDGLGSSSLLVPKPRQEAGRRMALSMSVIRGWQSEAVLPSLRSLPETTTLLLQTPA